MKTKMELESEIASEAKLYGLLEKPVVEFSREYLHGISRRRGVCISPPSHSWFGCETDAELFNCIEKSAKANGNLSLVNDKDLERVLEILYFG